MFPIACKEPFRSSHTDCPDEDDAQKAKAYRKCTDGVHTAINASSQRLLAASLAEAKAPKAKKSQGLKQKGKQKQKRRQKQKGRRPQSRKKKRSPRAAQRLKRKQKKRMVLERPTLPLKEPFCRSCLASLGASAMCVTLIL